MRLQVDSETGRGLVAAFDNGKPRALIQAGSGDSGSVSIVHDDGNTRVTMLGTESSGCVMTVNPDMKATVKLSSEGRTGGGLLMVNGPTGNPAVFLTAEPTGGVVVVNGADGRPAASLPDAGFEKGNRET